MAVDLRRSSPTFARHVAVELTDENCEMLWIPPGFGHAFLVLSDEAGFAYKVTDYYAPSAERTILWNDPDITISWPISASEVLVSTQHAQRAPPQSADLFQ